MVAQVPELKPGTEPYPGYCLKQFIGSGGWGEVWRATRPDGQPVALKFLPCGSRQQASREIRAIQFVRNLEHPYLIGINQIWSGADYIVVSMELAEGNLLDLYEVYYEEFRKPIPANHLCYYLGHAASALDFLNTRQHMINGRRVAVRHCDVKPSNLLITGNTVKLCDYSLSVQATSSMWYYEKVGTLAYAAPEVFRGWISDSSDQYSLALTYHHLRTGTLPFDEYPRSFSSSYTRPDPDLSGLAKGEQPILRRALCPTPQDRWPSCTDMIEQLARVVPKDK
ncbi:MAG: serine/threonine-protein kinase [Gemmataceae bacterium]